MTEAYKYFRWLSLDIVLGAILFLIYLGAYYRIHIGIPTYLALGSAVWLIYTADHLMDAAKTENPTTARHQFHKQYFTPLVMVSGLVLILALINLLFLEIRIIRSGAVLAAISVAYLMLVYWINKLWVKEVLVAVVYAVGIFLAPLNDVSIELKDMILTLQLAGIAFLNLLVFANMDFESDEADGFGSLAIQLGKQNTYKLINIVIITLLCLNAGMMLWSLEPIQYMYSFMVIILSAIHFRPNHFMAQERFRVIGDGVFYLPALFLLF